MKPQRWNQINEVLLSALEREAAERSQFIEEAIGSDEELRREVQSLLASYEQAISFMEEPVTEAAARLIADDQPHLEAGHQIDHYRIVSLIGTGGMGEVYLARDMKLGRQVALKLLPQRFTENFDRLRRFQQEARSASTLNHPNILTIYEIGEAGSAHYIATEFIDGLTLRQRMKESQSKSIDEEISNCAGLKLTEMLDIAIQLASALEAAHSANIVHRDIKPENIMLRRDGYIKILDFGVAKLTEPFPEEQINEEYSLRIPISTKPGEIIGTASYMSPEQLRGLSADPRTDIWSAGIVLYEMIAGHQPFEASTTSDVIALILRSEPVPLAIYCRNLPAEIERIVMKALCKDREERYQTAKDLGLDLKRLKQRLEFEAKLGAEELIERIEAGRRNRFDSIARADSSINNSGSSAIRVSPPNNLSAEVSPLIDREEETADIERLLRREDVRLVTLTGVGGTGKTRLARRVAQNLIGEFPDGAFFVDLSSVRDPEMVVSALVKQLGVIETCADSPATCLINRIRTRMMLMVIDNFEQVMGAAPLVAELLAASPHLKVLVTSRASLHLSGEYEFTVRPLPMPVSGFRYLPDELIKYGAIALFVERAQAVNPGFTLSQENSAAVVEICARLDGLPLAIELAAARIKLLSPEAILLRLENSLSFLTHGARDLPARQHCMRGAIEWSYDLLDDDEKRLLNRLAVFAGGSTLEAAELVANADQDLNLDILDGITSLVDKSLLIQQREGDGEPRFRLLGVVRDYALERLKASGEMSLIQQRHARYFLELSEGAEPGKLGTHSAGWLKRLRGEHYNLRTAIEWSLIHDTEMGLRFLSREVQLLWVLQGHLKEWRVWLERTLKNSTGLPETIGCKMLNGAGCAARRQGDYEAAQRFYEDGLRVARSKGAKVEIAASSKGLGVVAIQRRDHLAARSFSKECLEIGRELNDLNIISDSLTLQGEVARAERDYFAASSLYEEALSLSKQAGNKIAIITNLIFLGAVACLEDSSDKARSYFTEALAVNQKLGHRFGLFTTLHGFAALSAKQNHSERAARLFGSAEAVREALGYEMEINERAFCDSYAVALHTVLGEEAFMKAASEGRAMKTRKAIDLALESNNPS